MPLSFVTTHRRRVQPALAGALAAAALAATPAAQADSAGLLALAQRNDATRYASVVASGVELRATTDNLSFSAWWQPSGWKASSGVIVALHGHDGYASTEAYLWLPYARKYGHALLTLQWWFGGGESTGDYYRPDQMYPLIAGLLASKGVKPGTVMFTGYSRGSANSYATAVLDNTASAGRYFGFVFSNAGGAATDYGPNQAISAGSFGPNAFGGMKWGFYCGEKDADPQINGCPAMQAARDWVQNWGASTALFIDDPKGDHGGFMTSSANVETALGTYASLLAAANAAPTGAALSSAEVDCLLNWAEDSFPTDLQPRRSATQSLSPYTYRYYATSRVYAGVSSADQHAYLVDTGGALRDLGPAATWSSRARCR